MKLNIVSLSHYSIGFQNITQKVVTHIFLIILNPYFHILGLKVLGQMIAVKEILRNPKSLPSCK